MDPGKILLLPPPPPPLHTDPGKFLLLPPPPTESIRAKLGLPPQMDVGPYAYDDHARDLRWLRRYPILFRVHDRRDARTGPGRKHSRSVLQTFQARSLDLHSRRRTVSGRCAVVIRARLQRRVAAESESDRTRHRRWHAVVQWRRLAPTR